MAHILPDEIIHNILARLPAKPLLRCRAVSKYWNRLITDPYFMNKLRSRRTIIIPQPQGCLHIDVTSTPNSILKLPYPLETQPPRNIILQVIGTLNGIVVLALFYTIILYNPLTGASKTLPHPPIPTGDGFEYGFGYGATTPDDLKIVMFRRRTDICEVYNLKNSSWTHWRTSQYNIRDIMFKHDVGTFLNGFLYWITYRKKGLTVLNVKDMVLSEIHVPEFDPVVLGTIDNGCLCSLSNATDTGFNVWVMNNEHNTWSIKFSIKLPLDSINLYTEHCPFRILDSGRILMVSSSGLPEIYDMSNDSNTTFINVLTDQYYCYQLYVLEYVESLLSPSDICFPFEIETE